MSDLRIYYGNARIIIDGDDPRVERILALVMQEAQPRKKKCRACNGTGSQPRATGFGPACTACNGSGVVP